MVGTVITVLLIVLLVVLITAPFEALEWWADWFEDDPAWAKMLPPAERVNTDARCFLVYLTGVGGVEPETYAWRENQLFTRLKAAMPDVVLVHNIFPYSMNNVPLTGQRLFSWLWRLIERARVDYKLPLIGFLIDIRNIAQVIVSVDHRYGPFYNRGVAVLVQRALANQGYPFGSGVPVVLMGYSGGVQIATGAVTFLEPLLQAPIDVISLGGVFGSSRGHMRARHFYHIVGERDWVVRFGHYVFPRRWRLWRPSQWNRALRSGRATLLSSHARTHTGRRGYLDPKREAAPGQTYLDETVETVVQIVQLAADEVNE